MTREFTAKRDQINQWLAARDTDAVLLTSTPNLYWVALGGEVDRLHSDSAAFVVTPDRCFLLCPNDDADRVQQEEVRGLDLEIVPLAQLGAKRLVECARSLLPETTRWCCDRAGLGFEHDPSFKEMRRTLQPEEIERLRKLGRDACTALEEVATESFRGILERDAAARLAAECVRRQMVPRLILAGADERLASYPRPIPKAGSAQRVLLLSLVAMRQGLHVALSRMICLTKPEAGFVERFLEVLEVGARLCHEARAGETLGDVVRRALPEPSSHLGSLGALAGYSIRELNAHPESTWTIRSSQALTWSVAYPGMRCEDTYLVTDTGPELLTTSDGWPRRQVQVDDRTYEIPDLLLL